MSKNNLKFFDFEVFPEWWCCVVSDEEEHYNSGLYENKFTEEDEINIKNKMRVYTSDENQTEVMNTLKTDFSKGIICGYNIKRYDLIIAKCIFSGFSPRKLYIASELLIHPEKAYQDAEYARIASYIKFGWNGAEAWQDLMDDNVKGLKDKECALGMDIRETTVPFGKTDLTQQEKDDIIFYCKHDVYALHVYYAAVSIGYIDTKIDLCNSFELPVKTGYVNTNATLSGKVLGAERAHGTTITDPTIIIRDEDLAAYFRKWLPTEIYEHLLTSQTEKEFKLYDNNVTIADGGLHSVYAVPKIGRITPGLYAEATDEWTMYNIDISSCHPSVMIFCGAMSRAIKKPERLMYIYNRRLKLKAKSKKEWTPEEKRFVPAAKLVLNTTYGAMGNKYLALYDDYMRSKVCRVSQMILIALGNCIYNSIDNLKVLQNNTDGILVYTKRNNLSKLKALVDEFSKISKFVFEIEEDHKLWQLNVNNYIGVHEDGEIKNKGGSFVTTIYQSGYNRLRPLNLHIIPKAQIEFYTSGGKVNPVKYILDNTDISDMCLTCTKGPGYDNMIQYNKTGIIELGKVSRVIAVTDDNLGVIKKRGINKRKGANYGNLKEDTCALCPEHPLVVDDALYNYRIENRQLIHKDGRRWNIDYNYYVKELGKILELPWYKIKDDTCGFTKEFDV